MVTIIGNHIIAEKFKKAQVAIELCLVFMAFVTLLVGLVRVTVWFLDDIVKRQERYEVTRLNAGTYKNRTDGVNVSYYKDKNHQFITPREKYMSEGWVFNGETPPVWEEED